MMRTSQNIYVVALVTTLLLAACSGDGNTSPPTEAPEVQPSATEAVPTAASSASRERPEATPTATATPTVAAEDVLLPIVDMHFHPDAAWDIDALVELMDKLGVREAIGGSSGAGSQALVFAKEYPDRFIPFAGQDGIRALNLIQGAPSWNLQTNEIRAYLDDLEAQLQAGCWAGIGEIYVNTQSSHVSGGFSVPTDTPLMRRLLDLAAAYDTPLSVHMDAAPDSVEGLRSLLASRPNGTFIWAHAGWFAEPDLLRDLLQSYANLYIELSFRDEVRSFFPTTSGGVLLEGWRTLFEEMPDRFVIGTDLNPPPTAQKYSELVDFWREVLDQLSPDAAAMIAHENAERLIDDTPTPDVEACIEMLGG